jgi:hypothetical protein
VNRSQATADTVIVAPIPVSAADYSLSADLLYSFSASSVMLPVMTSRIPGPTFYQLGPFVESFYQLRPLQRPIYRILSNGN